MAWSLSNEERAKLRSAFLEMDKDQSGTIKLWEFKKCIEDNFNLSDTEVTDIFNAVDNAHNGEIQYTEFLAAMVSSRVHLYDDFLSTAFSRFYVDASGYITKENLKE